MAVNCKATAHWYWFLGIKNFINFNYHGVSAFKSTNDLFNLCLCSWPQRHVSSLLLCCRPRPRHGKQAGHVGSLAPVSLWEEGQGEHPRLAWWMFQSLLWSLLYWKAFQVTWIQQTPGSPGCSVSAAAMQRCLSPAPGTSSDVSGDFCVGEWSRAWVKIHPWRVSREHELQSLLLHLSPACSNILQLLLS